MGAALVGETDASIVEAQSLVHSLQKEGNAAYSAQDYKTAVRLFGQAIDLCKANPSVPMPVQLYSNRSASYCGLKRWGEALTDADSTIKMNPQAKWLIFGRIPLTFFFYLSLCAPMPPRSPAPRPAVEPRPLTSWKRAARDAAPCRGSEVVSRCAHARPDQRDRAAFPRGLSGDAPRGEARLIDAMRTVCHLRRCCHLK